MKYWFSRVISCGLSPNVEGEDIWQAWQTLWQPWTWRRGKATEKVRDKLRHFLAVRDVCLFNSGRSALWAILKSFNIGPGDEVLLQAFSCVAVPNSVLWVGAKPIYVDIDTSLNMDPEDAARKITPHTRAIILQHTFGWAAQIEKLRTLARQHHLIIIEDCAHSLGEKWQGQKLGTLGDAAFFSFGRDKVVSSVWGGAATISAKLKVPSLKLKTLEKSLPYPSFFWIFQQLLHPISFSPILASYNIGLGKLFLFCLQRLRLLSLPVYSQELQGRQPKDFPARFPNALACLLERQLVKLPRFNQRRRVISRYYAAGLKKQKQITLVASAEVGYLRFPIMVRQPEKYLEQAKKIGILLGRWYHHVIDPAGVDLAAIGYQLGSCPKAEAAAATILNLPTLITPAQAGRVLAVVTQR